MLLEFTSSKHYAKLQDILREYPLTQHIITITHGSDHILDLFITNKNQKLTTSAFPTSFSDNHLIYSAIFLKSIPSHQPLNIEILEK